jgi:CubicO group peptidase (beta-lactamase class C family)
MKNAGNMLEKVDTHDRLTNTSYFSGAGGLMTDTQDNLQFGQILLNGGELNGKRLLNPRTVDLMASIHVPDTLPGRCRRDCLRSDEQSEPRTRP